MTNTTSTETTVADLARLTTRSLQNRGTELADLLDKLAREATEAAARVRLGQTYVGTEGLVQLATSAVRSEAVRGCAFNNLVELDADRKTIESAVRVAPRDFTGWAVNTQGTDWLVTGKATSHATQTRRCAVCGNEADLYTVTPVVEPHGSRVAPYLYHADSYTECHGCLSADFTGNSADPDDDSTFSAPCFNGYSSLI